MKEILVYFNVKKHYRRRQQETLLNLPGGIGALSDVEEFITDHKLVHYSKKSLLMVAKQAAARILPLINAKHIRSRKMEGADLIYSWGGIILNNKPYLVELDNPVSLTFYNWGALKNPLTKWLLRKKLMGKSCRGINCMSKACMRGVGEILGKDVLSKCTVVYPYAKELEAKKKKGKTVNLLFVSTQFYLKGGKELLLAFEGLEKKYPQARLTVISNTPKEILRKYSRNPKIKFLEANVPKEKLISDFYPTCDIFVLPTYKDSFGLVILEAISAGLPVVSTDLYAIPEMVEHGKNGFLVEPPIRYFEKNCLPSDRFWTEDIGKYASEHEFPEVVGKLEEYLGRLIGDGKLRREMSANSRKIFRKKFSEKMWKEKINQVITGAMRD